MWINQINEQRNKHSSQFGQMQINKQTAHIYEEQICDVQFRVNKSFHVCSSCSSNSPNWNIGGWSPHQTIKIRKSKILCRHASWNLKSYHEGLNHIMICHIKYQEEMTQNWSKSKLKSPPKSNTPKLSPKTKISQNLSKILRNCKF